jgi:hypothetical protein
MKIRIDKLDKLFSEYIRKRAIIRAGGCERGALLGLSCGCKTDLVREDGSVFPAWKRLECAHYEGRGRKRLRYFEDNALGLCHGCHQDIDAYPSSKETLFLNILGSEAFERLKIQAEITTKSSPIDKGLIELYLKQKIKELDSNPVGYVEDF